MEISSYWIMKLLVVIAPERFRDEELFEPEAVFSKSGIETDRVSLKRGVCRGMLGGSAQVNLTLTEVKDEEYDGIVLVGGSGSKEFLWGDTALRDVVKRFSSAGKLTAAICLAPVVLARSGILAGKRATVFASPDAMAEMKKGGAVLERVPVVTEGRIITADGPAAARSFAEAVVAALRAK